jgi:WD40 repeat protein
MKPILTINEPKVDSVSFSPCERYLLVYSPHSDLPYAIWNFQTLEKIREFDQSRGEDAHSFKWSFDGSFIAKIVRKEVTPQTEE